MIVRTSRIFFVFIKNPPHQFINYKLSTPNIHYQLSTTHYPLPIIHYLLSTTHYPLPLNHYPLSTTQNWGMGAGSGFSTPSRNQRAQNGATPGEAQLIWAQSGAILSTLISLNPGTPGYGPRSNTGYGPRSDIGYAPRSNIGYGPRSNIGYGPRSNMPICPGHERGRRGLKWADTR